MKAEGGEKDSADRIFMGTQLGELEERIIACRKCLRLVAYREEVGRVRRKAYRDQEYWAKPVPGFGDANPRVLVVGLAPGAHGSNRTGRMFTGDDSGVFLYRALFRAGFANQPNSSRPGDGMVLKDIFISAVCRCAPPDNKPTRLEQADCLPYLEFEIKLFGRLEGIVALGRIGFEGVLSVYAGWGYPLPPRRFAHNALNRLGEGLPWLVASYHPSRQNTQTGRLTEAMFAAVWEQVNRLLARV